MAQAAQGKSLFVILPNLNIWNADNPGNGQTFLHSASRQLHASTRSFVALSPGKTDLDVTLVDEVAPSDTVLVSMGEPERVNLLRAHPGLRVVPVGELEPLWLQRFRLAPVLGVSAGPKVVLEVTVTDAATGAGLPNVDVVGLTDRAGRIGASNKTNSKGVAKLMFPASTAVLESVEAFVPSGYWPGQATGVAMSNGAVTLSCAPIDLAVQDVRGYFGFEGADTDGQGVKVGVVDTGVSKHPDLRFAKGLNVVKGEPARNFSDLLGHGTHVAGIIAGRGQPGKGVRGVAPGVDLHVYRVFGKGQEKALSFNIAKGIRQAVDDGCDLINLSLGGEADVPDVLREIHRARAMGVLCIAAAGNDYRSAVNYPARYSPVMGISAFGRKGTWPAGAAQDLEVLKPLGTDKKNFVASFSNVGSEVDLVGPGVGVVSTYPGGYAVMDGTSMACPVTSGALARLLGRNPKILGMDRDQKRSDAIVKLALNATQLMGFGAKFEGAGLLM
ncbi:S8 family serine peptidase [Acidovorax sp. SUPP2522]|uniref:S8 family serine peptidase n=1 Tax=unclassified Acidovorax TaxID=2684926 RepID=UPI0023492E54|nr:MULTISPECIES: S8 family serine peptidase [unclassified Acidovorax]WCM99602.1 S8 family serine peptidase [Acidovorax sp. GBBC 1281]GKT18300.1 S8 family serine peptidase [Acidovorax sp. SUPP2522]